MPQGDETAVCFDKLGSRGHFHAAAGSSSFPGPLVTELPCTRKMLYLSVVQMAAPTFMLVTSHAQSSHPPSHSPSHCPPPPPVSLLFGNATGGRRRAGSILTWWRRRRGGGHRSSGRAGGYPGLLCRRPVSLFPEGAACLRARGERNKLR